MNKNFNFVWYSRAVVSKVNRRPKSTLLAHKFIQIRIFLVIINKHRSIAPAITKINLNLAENRKKICWINTPCNNDSASQSKWPSEQDILDEAFGVKSLISVYQGIRSNLTAVMPCTSDKVTNKINMKWFNKTSSTLKLNTFKCPTKKKVFMPKKQGSNKLRILSFTLPRIKIIEKSILTAIEPFWKGSFKSEVISYKEFKESKNNKKKDICVFNKEKKKIWTIHSVFTKHSYDFQPKNLVLQKIKSWPQNTSFFAKFHVVHAFDHIHRLKLKKNFLNHCPYRKIWNIIEKMLNVNTFEMKQIFNKTKTLDISLIQNNLLSLFLFNIYMTPLDKYVKKLKNKNFVGAKLYKNFINKDNSKKDSTSKLRKHGGSVKSVFTNYKKKQEKLLKRYTRFKKIKKDKRNILYARYANDWILAFVGPYRFAQYIANKIGEFLINELHLNLNEIKIVNHNRGSSKFLDFDFTFSHLRRKVKQKISEIRSIKKYKKKNKARLITEFHNLSKTFYNRLKHDIINAFNKDIKKKQAVKYHTTQINKLVKPWLKNKDFESIHKFKKIAKLKMNYVINKKRYSLKKRNEITNHFKNLFSKNFSIALKSFIDNFKPLLNNNFLWTNLSIEVKRLTKKFVKDLETIQNKNEWIKNTKERAIFDYKYENKYKNRTYLKWSGFTEENLGRNVKLLALKIMDKKQIRKVQIKFNINEFYEKLRLLDYLHSKRNKIKAKTMLLNLNDHEIINYYNRAIKSYLNWYNTADNSFCVKKIYYVLANSCLLTLRKKHKKNLSWALREFTFDVHL